MSEVKVTSSHLVQPADPSVLKEIKEPWLLGPFDYTLPYIYPTAVMFAYEGGDDAIPVEQFKGAIARLLDHYPHFTGRLGFEGEVPTRVEQFGTGAPFTIAECELTLKEVRAKSKDGHLLASNLPQGGFTVLPPPVDEHSPLRVQHTRFACGSVIIGITILHVLCDGHAYFKVARDLCTLYNTGKLEEVPIIKAYANDLFRKLDTRAKEEYLKIVPKYYKRFQDVQQDPEWYNGSQKVTGKVWRFTRNALDEMVKEASSVDKSTPTQWVSTFDSLGALIYRSILAARAQDHTADKPKIGTHVTQAVNMREVMGISPSYASNCFLTTSISWPNHDVDNLANAPLSEIAARIHEVVRSKTKEDITEQLNVLASLPAQSRFDHSADMLNVTCFLSSWSKFDMYTHTTYEGIRPALIASPFTPFSSVPGLAFLLEAPEAGALDAYICLPEGCWTALAKDQRWNKYAKLME